MTMSRSSSGGLPLTPSMQRFLTVLVILAWAGAMACIVICTVEVARCAASLALPAPTPAHLKLLH
jgi:hypothetical protein